MCDQSGHRRTPTDLEAHELKLLRRQVAVLQRKRADALLDVVEAEQHRQLHDERFGKRGTAPSVREVSEAFVA